MATSVSTTDSWQEDQSIKFSSDGAFVGVGFEQTFGSSESRTDSFDTTLKYTADSKIWGPDVGEIINHDYDEIFLLLGPEIAGKVYPDQLKLAIDTSRAEPQIVRVGWLKGTLPMPLNVHAKLLSYGITEADYAQMLLLDPFANDPIGGSRPDPSRFAQVAYFPYEATGGQFTYQTNNNYTTTTTTSQKDTQSVKVTSYIGPMFFRLSISDQFTWTYETKNTRSSARSDTETLALTLPSPGYTGPTVLYVYVDKMYQTFLLSFVGPVGTPPSLFTVSPDRGPDWGGTRVTLTGSGFAPGMEVTFGGISATSITVLDAFTLRATTPAHAVGPVDVRVTVNGRGGPGPNGFTYFLNPAKIMSIIDSLLQ
jgi:hypothetical protein